MSSMVDFRVLTQCHFLISLMNRNPQAVSFLPAIQVQESLLRDVSEIPDGSISLEPFRSLARSVGVPLSIVVDKNTSRESCVVEMHRTKADVWICIDGTIHFEIGGVMQNPRIHADKNGVPHDEEIRAKSLSLGTVYTLGKGAVLYIPEGQPHKHWTHEGSARLWVVKIPARDPFPLDAIEGLN